MGSAIIDAAKAGDSTEVRRLLAADPTLVGTRNEIGETPVMAALYRGHAAVVDLLLAAGAPLDVFAASATGRTDALREALGAAPASVNAFAFDGWTPLHLAAFFGRLGIVEALLESGANLNVVSRNSLRNAPLHAAIAGNHSDVALLLIERGADVHAADAGGHTPLHIAAENGSLPVVRILVERGADPRAVDAEDRTPLARAAARNHTAIVDLLVEKKA